MRGERTRAGSIRRSLAGAVAAGAAGAGVALPGCGSGSDYANEPRPAAPINVTAAITDQRVRISPRAFGAGPIVLIIANQSSRSQAVTLETDDGPGGGRPGIRQTAGPVNPRGTAELKVDVREGIYRLGVRHSGVRPAAMHVGRPRPSAQNDLLQP